MIVVSHNNSATTTRLLLVDNEPDNTSVLSMGLEDEGFNVDAFTDPILALSNFKPNYYSLVILDINMPKMNGYDLYKEIRKLDNKVKICFLTASELYNENLRSQTKEILDEVNSVSCSHALSTFAGPARALFFYIDKYFLQI